jgi:signal transduction histidine kinase
MPFWKVCAPTLQSVWSFVNVPPGRWMPLVERSAHRYGYAAVAGLAAVATVVGIPGTAPSSDPAYAPMALALIVGMLLTVRLAPNRGGAALVLLPAMAVDARFGLAALPAIAFAAVLVSLVRRQRGPQAVTAVSHLMLAYAAAHLCAEFTPLVPGWVTFALVFAFGRKLVWHLASRLDGAFDPRAERPEVLLSLPLAPIGLLPLAAGERLGDGGMLLAMAALLALLFVVREAANLATARAEMEGERDKLARANVLQDELINLLTHELRNPLTLVMSYVGHIERAGKLIQRLMENLLDLSKLESADELPAPEPVQVASIVKQVIFDLSPLAKQKQQSLEIEPTRDLEPALTVPLLLHQALTNLISNAVKYTPAGGQIRVSAERGREPHTIVVGVRDTGIGLSPEDQRRLFTKFFRSSDPLVQRERGTGLGLALTHALITRIGGKITVESQPGQGTVFHLTLPSAAA